jgi:hypothetical protein
VGDQGDVCSASHFIPSRFIMPVRPMPVRQLRWTRYRLHPAAQRRIHSAWVGTLVELGAFRWVARRTRRKMRACTSAKPRSCSSRGAPLSHACGGHSGPALRLAPPGQWDRRAPACGISATHDTTYPPHSF